MTQTILLYEFFCSGGLFARSDLLADSALRQEGLAMLAAVAADFAGVPDTQIAVMIDARFRDELCISGAQFIEVISSEAESELLANCSKRCDWTLVIAPEFDGLLHQRSLMVDGAGGRLLGPSPPTIALAGDKHATAQRLTAAGVPAPRGWLVEPAGRLPEDFPFPVVLKPCDGAGAHNVRLLTTRRDAIDHQQRLARPGRLEPFISGSAASVAVLCGPEGNIALPACSQHLSTDGQFRYLGGACPIPPHLNERAQRLARRAIDALGPVVGYLGVDLVLGDDPTGGGDVVIEINPRLTTSYIGLRAAVRENLAAAMLEIASDIRPPPCRPSPRPSPEGRGRRLSHASRRVEFDSSGAMRDRGPV